MLLLRSVYSHSSLAFARGVALHQPFYTAFLQAAPSPFLDAPSAADTLTGPAGFPQGLLGAAA